MASKKTTTESEEEATVKVEKELVNLTAESIEEKIKIQEEAYLSKDNFDLKECEQLLADEKIFSYRSMHRLFETVANKAQKEDNNYKEKIYRLLSLVCSMRLVGKEVIDPFGTSFYYPRDPLTSIKNFKKSEIRFLSEIVEDTKHFYLKARLADIVWIRQPEYKYADMAIKAYHATETMNPSFSYHSDSWICWGRALTLARMLNKIDFAKNLKNQAYELLNSIAEENTHDILGASNFLLRCDTDNQEKKYIAEKLEKAGSFLKKDEKRNMQTAFLFKKAAKWYDLSGEKEKSYELILTRVDILSEMAKIRRKEGRTSSSSMLLKDAIETLDTLPESYRDNRKISYINDIQKSAKEINEEKQQSSADVIKMQVDATIIKVQGIDKLSALKAFANISSPMNLEKLKSDALKIYEENNLPFIADNEEKDKEKSEYINKTLMRNYRFYIQAIAQTLIIPALKIIVDEHQIIMDDFHVIAQESSVIKYNCVDPFAKAIFAGYEQDYITSLSILAPQVEAMVRWRLKREKIITTKSSTKGEEEGLGHLLGIAKKEEILTKNEIFEIKSLFLNGHGANLRNNAVHGLMEQSDFDTAEVIYAWWFIFSLIFKSCEEGRLKLMINRI